MTSDHEPTIKDAILTAKPIDPSITKRVLKFCKFIFTIIGFIITLLIFMASVIPVVVYGIGGSIILLFCLAILLGQLWLLLFMLRTMLPDFNITLTNLFDVNEVLKRPNNDDSVTR